MESGGRKSEDFPNSNLEKSSQQSDEVSGPSSEQTTNEDTLTNNGDVYKSTTQKESFKGDINGGLCENNNELELLDTESSSDVPANQSLVSKASLHSNNSGIRLTTFGNLFKDSLYQNTCVSRTGNEILPSTSNAPETLENPPSDVISNASEIHVCDCEHDYANKQFQNVSEYPVCDGRPLDNDHTYTTKRYIITSDNTENIPVPFRIEEIDTEDRNIFDANHIDFPYACPECKRTFQQLTDHCTHHCTHSTETQSTSSQSDTQATQHEVYQREKTNVCDRCSFRKKLDNRSSSLQNVCVNTGEKPYVCSSCGKEFSQNGK